MAKKWRDEKLQSMELQDFLNKMNTLMENTNDVVFYDLETTGTKKTDRIIQFGAIRYDLKLHKIIDQTNIFILCPFSIPAEASAVNHITDEILMEKGIPEELAVNQIRSFIKDSDVIVGYNNNKFDDKFMERLYSDYGYTFTVKESLDVYKLAKIVILPEEVMAVDPKTGVTKPSYRLQVVYDYYNDDLTINFHDAVGDVEGTISILENLIKDAKKRLNELALSKEEVSSPRWDAKITSISFFSPSNNIRRVYINTDQGTFYYDDLLRSWAAKKGNINSFDMDSLKQKVFSIADVQSEDELFKEMRIKRKIHVD